MLVTKVLNIIKDSFRNIKNNKLRSALTMLGLIIGIASVIILVGIGNGSTSSITDSVSSLGADILTLDLSSSDYTLSYSQLDEITEISNVDSVAPYKTTSGTVTRESTSSNKASIIATTADYMNVMNLTISSGRLLSEIDVENYSKVCLIGSDLADTLFELSDPVGQSIQIDGDNYTVIGVLTATRKLNGSWCW